MATENEDSDEYSFLEGLRGMAHLYDLYHDKMRGIDPEVRNKIDTLDSITIEDLIRMADHKAGKNSGSPDPHVEIADTREGIEVAIDSQRSPVEAFNINAYLVGEGDRLRIEDRKVGWYTVISPDDDDELFADCDVSLRQNDITVVKARFKSAGLAAGLDGDADQKDSSSSASQEDDTEWPTDARSPPDPTPVHDEDEVPTFNEFVDENPWAEEMFENMVGSNVYEMFRSTFGDMKVTDVPKGPAGLAAVEDEQEIEDLIESEWEGEGSSPFNFDDDESEDSEA